MAIILCGVSWFSWPGMKPGDHPTPPQPNRQPASLNPKPPKHPPASQTSIEEPATHLRPRCM